MAWEMYRYSPEKKNQGEAISALLSDLKATYSKWTYYAKI